MRLKYTRWTIEQARDWAKNLGGEILCDVFRGVRYTYKWRCSNGHIWESRAYNILHCHTWCPTCSRNITEEKCRFILEQITQEEWTSTRSVLGNRELDGYCSRLNAAFEYNGEQHYNQNHIFRKAKIDFTSQQSRDQEKIDRAKQLGIKLIIIPYTEKYKLTDFIIQQLNTLDIPIMSKVINWDNFNYCRSKLRKLQYIADTHDGKLLDTCYKGGICKYNWQCKHDHKWLATIHEANRRWCIVCNKANRIHKGHKNSYKNNIYKRNEAIQKYKSRPSQYIDWNDLIIKPESKNKDRVWVSVCCPACKAKRYKVASREFRKIQSNYSPLCSYCSRHKKI